MVKNLPAMQETGGFDPWVRKIIWRREWQPTPVLLPGESHGQKSLVGYSPRGHKELDMAGHLTHGHRNSQTYYVAASYERSTNFKLSIVRNIILG